MKIIAERKYQTWAGWRKAAKEAGATRFEGDKDIAQAFAGGPRYEDSIAIGEWDGAEGSIYVYQGARRNPAFKIIAERKYQTWAGWRKAAKEAGATRFEGDKDIAQAFAGGPSYEDSIAIGEWDGVEGSIYVYQGRSSRRNPYPRRNPLDSGADIPNAKRTNRAAARMT